MTSSMDLLSEIPTSHLHLHPQQPCLCQHKTAIHIWWHCHRSHRWLIVWPVLWGNWNFYVNATMYHFHWLEIEKNQKCLFIKNWLVNHTTKALQKYYQIFSSISIYLHIIWTITQFPMNIFVLFDVLDPHGPICSCKTSFLSIVPIPWSHVIAGVLVTKVSQYFKLRPDLATTVNASYLHNHQLSWAQIWWRSQLVSWLQVYK